MERLLGDIFEEHPKVRAAASLPRMIEDVLHAYEMPGAGRPVAERLAGILRLAEALDHAVEAQPLTGDETGEMLEALCGGVDAGLWPENAIRALVVATRQEAKITPESWQVPVFPQAALQMLEQLRDPQACLGRVVKAASLDPATAGMVVRLANSALFGARVPVSTISQAITRLGFATSQRVILSAAMRPLFHSVKLRGAWEHSVEVADICEQLARRAGTVDPAEAYLVGLMHDVGRIALLSGPLYHTARLEGLERGGCPPVYAENLLLHTDHAELGARITEAWRFPRSLVVAIWHHHRAECAENGLSYVLYLAEHVSGSEEDLPSVVRLSISLKGTGLTWEDIEACNVSKLGCWLAAA
jgi:putative nucleotidyltransferase with HDIG domain